MRFAPTFALRIHPSVQAELDTAAHLDASGNPVSAFSHLEHAHILGQQSTVHHVRVHRAMFSRALEVLQWRFVKDPLPRLARCGPSARIACTLSTPETFMACRVVFT